MIPDRQAHAVIPPRKNAKISSIKRNELLQTAQHLGSPLYKRWSGYHRLSLVETNMHCIRLLGDKLTARHCQSQINEIHARVAVVNIFTELSRSHTQVFT